MINNDKIKYATGRRKSSVARIYLINGTGKIIINKCNINKYFNNLILQSIIKKPLIITNTIKKFDILINVYGGGFIGQAEAIRHGISRALLKIDNKKFKLQLKQFGYLTRDPRMKERKKYGFKAARRSTQFSKR